MDTVVLRDYKDPRTYGKPMITEKQRKDFVYVILLVAAFVLILGIAGKSDNDSRIITDVRGNVVTAGGK